MKLLYILSEYLPDSGGGIISHYARILPGLVSRGHRVKVLVANHGSLDRAAGVLDGVEVEYLKSHFVEEARVGCRKFRNDALWAFLPLAWGAFHQTNGGAGFDIVEATDWGLLFVPWVVSERKAKVVVSLHGSNGQVDWFSNPGRQSFDSGVVRLVEVAALPLADAIHANSRANAEFWREKTGREIRVIPPAYGGRAAADGGGTKADLTTECTESTEDRTESKEEAGARLAGQAGASESGSLASELADSPVSESPTRFASDPASLPATSHPILATAPKAQALDSFPPATRYPLPVTAPQALKGLVVGRLQNWKGAEVLCRALRLVPEIGIEWVGGDTDWGSSGRKASEYLAANYPDVFGKQLRWIGRLDRSEVAKKMHAAGFLVVPSLWDVFNLTVAEGMEAGLPVVCSRAAGAEMVIEHGKSGLLFDPAKPEELAACLNRIVEMSAVDRNEMGHKAQEVVKTLLSEERILNLLEGSYGDAIKRGVTTSKEAWLASLLSAGSECIASHPDRIWHRDVPKAALNAKKIVKKMIGRK